jgi:FAD/FMN-containing dehydrogenase
MPRGRLGMDMPVSPTFLEDASGLRGEADAIYRPATAEAVSALLAEAVRSQTPVTVAGALTGVTGGGVPHGGWSLSLEKFQSLDIHPRFAVAGAGVSLSTLQAEAGHTGQFYPPDPTEWTASVGGSISTNASGSRSLLYGATRRHVLALTVALMDGTIRTFERGEAIGFPVPEISLPRSTKHSAGYALRPGMDWVDLFTGAEGTLGVVLGAKLNLLPVPQTLLTGVVFFRREVESWDAVEAWRPIPGLRMIESFDGASLMLLRQRYPEIPPESDAALLIEQDCDGLRDDPVDAWVDRLEASGALTEASWFGTTPADRERFRKLRHALPELVNERVRRNGFQKMNSDFAVPLESNRTMLTLYRRRLSEEFRETSVLFGHIGDAHVHVNLLPTTAREAERGKEVLLEFARAAVALQGTVSAEHGLGKKKTYLLELQYRPEQIEAMHAVKRRLDPLWLLGQGTLFPKPAARR